LLVIAFLIRPYLSPSAIFEWFPSSYASAPHGLFVPAKKVSQMVFKGEDNRNTLFAPGGISGPLLQPAL